MLELIKGVLYAISNILYSIIAAAVFTLLGPRLVRWWSQRSAKLDKKNPQATQPSDGKQIGRRYLLISCLFFSAIAILIEMPGLRLSQYDITELIRKPLWIAYEPIGVNPSLTTSPDLNLVNKELEYIRQAGFNGIITFTSRGDFAEIPRLAKENNMAVIMGIWDPTDPQEIAAAISKRQYVDAYCVGHDGLVYRYSFEALVKAINQVRSRTGCPVSTTEKIDHYLNDESLLTIGDWLFPDCLLPIRDEETYAYIANAKRDVNNTIELANQLVSIAAKGNKKPILLKMVGYPKQIDCGLETTADEQTKFFIMLIDATRDVGTRLSSNVSVSMYSAFDYTWKRDPPFYPWEPCTGLLESDGTLRPATREIMKRRLP